MGNACVMGYNTWLTLKRPLPNRLNIVLSRKAEIEGQESVVVCRDIESVLSIAQQREGDLYVIGGAQVYQSFLADIEKWLVTEVPLNVEGADTFMPQNYLEGFEKTSSLEIGAGLTVSVHTRGPS